MKKKAEPRFERLHRMGDCIALSAMSQGRYRAIEAILGSAGRSLFSDWIRTEKIARV
jgi:hypothetical protein